MKTIKNKFSSFYLFLAIMSACAAFAAEDADSGQPPAGQEARFENAASRLNLTAEQKEKIKTLRQNQRQQMKALLQELQAKRQQLKEALNKPDATRASTAPLVAEIKAITAKMIDRRIDNILAAKETLTPEQLDKLQQFRQKHDGEKKGCRPFWLGKRRASGMENNEEEDKLNE